MDILNVNDYSLKNLNKINIVLVQMAEMFNQFSIVALEVNTSCPNTGHPMDDAEIVVDDVTSPITYVDEKTRQVLLPAFYADADAEYWLTERSGLYLGATYQKSKSFDQNLGSESATVNLGTTSGLQSGFTLRF